ncbi:MAG TPA: hypothetical protein VM489_02575 [Burkholderiales bacterium]|nr:hypothetical protein [Burkholderiales bacterium]
MTLRLALLFAVLPLGALAQQPHEQEIQRALIQLDERSAGLQRPPDPAAGRPLHPDPVIARELRPYERLKRAERKPGSDPATGSDPGVGQPGVGPAVKPLPLPGGAQAGVDAVALPRLAH